MYEELSTSKSKAKASRKRKRQPEREATLTYGYGKSRLPPVREEDAEPTPDVDEYISLITPSLNLRSDGDDIEVRSILTDVTNADEMRGSQDTKVSATSQRGTGRLSRVRITWLFPQNCPRHYMYSHKCTCLLYVFDSDRPKWRKSASLPNKETTNSPSFTENWIKRHLMKFLKSLKPIEQI